MVGGGGGGHKLRMRKEHERRRRRRRNRGDRVREAIVRRDKGGGDCGRERKEIDRVVWGREVGTTNSTL